MTLTAVTTTTKIDRRRQLLESRGLQAALLRSAASFAWATGGILIGAGGNEILTAGADWPQVTVEVGGETINRPAILEVM